jgi:hypothetical protein
MAANVLRSTIAAALLVIAATAAVEANAQCCGVATTAYYQPATYTAYSPVVYQTNYSGWYPGYFLDRIRARWWGAPRTYVASYPSTYVASYPSTYVASYPSTYVASYPSYTASYAASYAPVSACSTCTAAPQVTMRPLVACDPCSTCSPCSSCGVIQTSYVESSGCASCGTGGYGADSSSSTPSNGTPQPEIDPNAQTPLERSQMKVPPNGTEPPPAEVPDAATPDDATEGAETNANYLEPPELFDPKDRTAQHKVSPVRTALYQQAVGHRNVSNARQKITAEQAQRDAAGWTSASK